VKTSELTDKALAYAVACAKGMSFYSLRHCKYPDDHDWVMHGDGTIRSATEFPSNSMSRQYDYTFWSPHTDWSQGGPIIDAHDIDVLRNEDLSRPEPMAARSGSMVQHPTRDAKVWIVQRGATKLIAAMRCFVAMKLGDEVDVPKELL
jgi:Protein of unknown function (DUF2591)